MGQIEISSKEDLAKIGNDESYPLNGSYVLTADITLTGNWVSIGKPLSDSDEDLEDKSFTGTFDGGGHTVSNLNITINEEKDVTYIGLFGRIGSNGVVKNLKINGGTLSVSDKDPDEDPSCNIGSIAGVNHGIILNCTSNATINCYAPATDGGGIAGENGGTIQNCVFTGKVITSINGSEDVYGQVRIGGITGDNESGGKIQSCQVEAKEITNSTKSGHIYGQNKGTVTESNYEIGNNVTIVGRTLYKDGNWNTLCLPEDVTATQIADSDHPLNGATIKELDVEDYTMDDNQKRIYKTRVEGHTLYLHFVDAPTSGTIITAGKPYLVKWNDSSNETKVFPNITVSKDATPTPVTSNINEGGNVTFIGTYFSKDIDAAGGDNTILYVGAGNTLYYPNAAMSIGAFRAYFQLNNDYYAAEPGTLIKAFNLDFGEESTGVKEIFDTPKTKVQGWYDLSGRKVDGQHLQRGLYMKDGKKVLK